MKTVLAQTSGLAAIASILLAMNAAPAAGMKSGCSDCVLVGMIHETAGRLSLIASCSNLPSGSRTMPAVIQRRVPVGVLERLEVFQHVAAVVVLLLVDLPADAGLLQPLGVGGPAEAAGDHLVARSSGPPPPRRGRSCRSSSTCGWARSAPAPSSGRRRRCVKASASANWNGMSARVW